MGRKGEVVDYTSIPCDAPMPHRYLFCHGNGRGPEKLHVACRDGFVPATGSGDKGGGFGGIFSLAEIWTGKLRLRWVSLSGTSHPAWLSQHCAALAYVCQPQVCSSYSQAEL